MGKRSDHISSKREENVPPWKQEKCFFFLHGRAGRGTLYSYDHTASFPNTEKSVLFSQHFSNSHQFTKVDGVLLYSAESSRR